MHMLHVPVDVHLHVHVQVPYTCTVYVYIHVQLHVCIHVHTTIPYITRVNLNVPGVEGAVRGASDRASAHLVGAVPSFDGRLVRQRVLLAGDGGRQTRRQLFLLAVLAATQRLLLDELVT